MGKIGTDIGIVELIDRVLQKGVILNADLVITIADVPLLAANLRLALASVETMLKYGVMLDLIANKPLRAEGKSDDNEGCLKDCLITKPVELIHA